MVHEPRCKVCKSSHRAEYHRLRSRERKTYKELQEIAESRYGERISRSAFQRCFSRHVYPHVKATEVETSCLRNPVQQPNQISVEILLLEELLSCYRSTWDRYIRSEIDVLRNSVEKKKANNVEDEIIGINICFDALEEVASKLSVSKLTMSAEEYDYSIKTLKLLPSGVSEIFVYRFEDLYERGPSEPDGERLCGMCRSPHRVYIERLWKKMGMPQE